MDHCNPKCRATEYLVLGLVFIFVEKFTHWDIWVVLGFLLVLKALSTYVMPYCKCCEVKQEKKKK